MLVDFEPNILQANDHVPYNDARLLCLTAWPYLDDAVSREAFFSTESKSDAITRPRLTCSEYESLGCAHVSICTRWLATEPSTDAGCGGFRYGIRGRLHQVFLESTKETEWMCHQCHWPQLR